jgi:hypothetical protein
MSKIIVKQVIAKIVREKQYIDTVCRYSKMANCLLFYREQSYNLYKRSK